MSKTCEISVPLRPRAVFSTISGGEDVAFCISELSLTISWPRPNAFISTIIVLTSCDRLFGPIGFCICVGRNPASRVLIFGHGSYDGIELVSVLRIYEDANSPALSVLCIGRFVKWGKMFSVRICFIQLTENVLSCCLLARVVCARWYRHVVGYMLHHSPSINLRVCNPIIFAIRVHFQNSLVCSFEVASESSLHCLPSIIHVDIG